MILSFEVVFEALHGHKPYAWQRRLSAQVIATGWPKVIAAPTGAGKTAVLDIALHHLAIDACSKNRKAPRRIVFAVDRRVVVDQAFERARKIKCALKKAEAGPLQQLKQLLDAAAGGAADDQPLHVEQLRGGMPREDDWVRTPLQPTILCTTVDQLGSRLFFRGYGVSPAMAPIHAGLLGNDTLIILDEAHLSAAFAETLERVGALREKDVEQPLGLPFAATFLTATPRDTAHCFSLNAAEKAEDAIERRLTARKLATLIKPAGKKVGAGDEDLEEKGDDAGAGSSGQDPTPFVEAACQFRDQLGGAPTIAIVVNRVRLARAILDRLRPQAPEDEAASPALPYDAILLTGRARPAERDKLIEEYRERLEKPGKCETPLFVVATQCIEAGADFDFDALVTQIAPLDALAQRFGRLARSGERDGKPAPAVVVALPEDLKAKDDPVYGNRMQATWNWMQARLVEAPDASATAGDRRVKSSGKEPTIDFGPNALAALIAADPEGAKGCCSEAALPPVLRPADLDFWSMTNPSPHPDPHLSLYLHGDPRIETDVSIVWRADVTDIEDVGRAVDILSVMPPRPGEALQLPIWAARALLADAGRPDASDAPQRGEDTDDNVASGSRQALAWRGLDSRLVGPRDIRPGETLVVPSSYGGCDKFGWLPDPRAPVSPVEDIADVAAEPYAKRRLAVRLHPNLWPRAEGAPAEGSRDAVVPWPSILVLFADVPKRPHQITEWLDRILAVLDDARNEAKGEAEPVQRQLAPAFQQLEDRLEQIKERSRPRLHLPYPAGDNDVRQGCVIVAGAGDAGSDDDDASSFREQPQSLAEHVADVEKLVAHYTGTLGLAMPLACAVGLAARHHDDGKSDLRFQQFLRAVAGPAAASISADLAKSGGRRAPSEETRLREAAGLPSPWRHEVLSAHMFAERAKSSDAEKETRDLALWLIGTHHGQGRPFFRHVDPWDTGERQMGGQRLGTSPGPHRLDFDWCGDAWTDLFETLKRRHGTWGLACLEAMLRLADHRASESPEGARNGKTPPR